MTQQDLTALSVGENLDNLMNIDPKGYGVCRIIYSAARKKTGAPLSMNAAKLLINEIKAGSIVYIITGFVLLPHKKAEMDGIIGSMLLARALVRAFDAKPIIICPKECIDAARALAACVGLHTYDSIDEALDYPISAAVLEFTKDVRYADRQSEEIIQKGLPKAVISIEAPGANADGVYHNAIGQDVTVLEAKTDILFDKLRQMGVANLSIGDLGNEIGMGTISETLEKYVPYMTGENGEGILAATKADNILTATVSDWGVNAIIAALAFLKSDIEIMHTPEMEKDAMITASRAGMVDMYGWLTPAIDGTGIEINTSMVSLMRNCVESALKYGDTCAKWFEKVLELGFFEDKTV